MKNSIRDLFRINVLQNYLTTLVGLAAFIGMAGQQLLNFLHTYQIEDGKSLWAAIMMLLMGALAKHK